MSGTDHQLVVMPCMMDRRCFPEFKHQGYKMEIKIFDSWETVVKEVLTLLPPYFPVNLAVPP